MKTRQHLFTSKGAGLFFLFPGLLILLLCFCLAGGCTRSEKTFRFVFMTDIHLQPEKRAETGFKRAIEKVNRLNPDFVITGGDLVMDALEVPFERAALLYDLFLHLCGQLTMPVYHSLGNHEVFGLFKDSGVSEDHPEFGKKMFLKRLGLDRTYRSFDHKGWHFILLDSIGITGNRGYIGQVDQQQLQWLKEDLSQIDKATPIVVALHIPLASVYQQITKGANAALPESRAITNSLEILKAFKGYNLKLVLQGHLHIVEEIIYDNVRFVTGGAVSGKWWKGPKDGFPGGFVVVRISGRELRWTYETYGESTP